MVRTDHQRRQPGLPDPPLIRQLRADVSCWLYRTQATTRTTNRLRAVRARSDPAALQVFGPPFPASALHVLIAYPTPQAATQLGWSACAACARQQHERQAEQRVRASFAPGTLWVQQPAPEADPAVIAADQTEAVMRAQPQVHRMAQQEALGKQMHTRFMQHPDAALFGSFPGVGALLAPARLAKFGADRRRFPTPASLQARAGTCPVPEQRGRRKQLIKFRLGGDREFRWIAQPWAIASLAQSAWAVGYWEEVRQRSRSPTHADRCLANRWVAIAWKVWQSRQPDDEAYHLLRHRARARPRAG